MGKAFSILQRINCNSFIYFIVIRIEFWVITCDYLLIPQLAAETIGPFTSLLVVVPMAIACTVNRPSLFVSAFLELRANVRLKVNRVSSFVIATLHVLWSSLLLLLAVRIPLFNAFVWAWAKLMTRWASFNSSNSIVASDVFCTGLHDSRLCTSWWWAHDCPSRMFWVEIVIAW